MSLALLIQNFAMTSDRVVPLQGLPVKWRYLENFGEPRRQYPTRARYAENGNQQCKC
jgi:hypothetical protein